ncbi:hypothetical protein GCM10027033_27030 [Leucobacter ruminantium]
MSRFELLSDGQWALITDLLSCPKDKEATCAFYEGRVSVAFVEVEVGQRFILSA